MIAGAGSAGIAVLLGRRREIVFGTVEHPIGPREEREVQRTFRSRVRLMHAAGLTPGEVAGRYLAVVILQLVVDHEGLFKTGVLVQRGLCSRLELQQHGGRAGRRVAIEHLEFDSRRLGVLPRHVVDVHDLGLTRERLGLGAAGFVAHGFLPGGYHESTANFGRVEISVMPGLAAKLSRASTSAWLCNEGTAGAGPARPSRRTTF